MTALLRSVAAIAIVCSSTAVRSQPGADASHSAAPLTFLPALSGGYFPISSEATGRTYHIYIRLPQGYADNRSARYPVVYVLDGDSLFPILAATHLFLTIDDKMPEAIVVGIAYGSFDPAVNKRGVDFMPPDPKIPADRSGAPSFQRFLKAELLPTVEARYRADSGKRILFGQSRGGSFVLYSAFTDPDLFWGRIASSPALPPTREFFYSEPARALGKDLHLFIADGPGDRPDLRRETLAWLTHWASRKDSPWVVTSLPIEKGTHSANSPDAYRAAMRQLVGWSETRARVAQSPSTR